MHFLLSNAIPTEHLRNARQTMLAFLEEYEDLYGEEHMTFNVHALTHLLDTVEIWGPLWNYSAFGFEYMNGRLVRPVNGTRYAHCQIVEKFSYLSCPPRVWNTCTHSQWDESKQNLIRYFLKGYHLRKHSKTTHGTVFFGQGNASCTGMSYKKVVIHGFTICVKSLDKSRRVNSYVCLNNVFGRIQKITAVCRLGHVTCTCARHLVFRICKLKVVRSFFTEYTNNAVIYEVLPTDEVAEMRADYIQKCMAVGIFSKLFMFRVDQTHIFEAL